ncbi:fructuronate reductase [Agromyces hippuratus]|uniref:Mannitol-1-phosphate 5-dehydrogenase n=1 Tax=Agromyces hippuratus TaxID=286438 RepID=A0A852WWE8_9MICO|nr:mannitol dehydrogenase family protein [Agromyces hippuratus]NYG22426.1 fructuronate reductase [Agromyces hippuratus]
MSALPRLGRAPGAVVPPVRIVHLGLGAFHRSHQVWFTANASDAAEWGIAAFTVRSPDAARPLAEQGGLFTLVERGPDGDRATVLPNLVEAHDGADLPRFRELLADPSVAIVTLTVTERGYGVGPDAPTPEAFHADDVARLTAGRDPVTPLGRLYDGLRHRHAVGAGPITVVPCDNLPDNGALVARLLRGIADRVDPAFRAALEQDVSFVSTSVDRITPRTTAHDLEAAGRLTGADDHAPVVAEPFADWVLAGRFPAGRPNWESAGATFTDDVGPYTTRKLWLLNGAHTMLAARGLSRGHETVAAAMADPVVADDVEAFWAAAVRHLPADLEPDRYLARLRSRFANGRIEHRLRQIQQDAPLKIRLRILPVLEAEHAEGRALPAADRAIADAAAFETSSTHAPADGPDHERTPAS